MSNTINIYAIIIGLIVTTVANNAQSNQPTYREPEGYTKTCYAPNAITGELVPVIGVNGYANGFWAFAKFDEIGRPVIIYDLSQLLQLPRIMWRFTYYHECAHLKIPTRNEVLANCTALKEMRADGELDLSSEQILEQVHNSLPILQPQYGGTGKAFWDATVACAGQR